MVVVLLISVFVAAGVANVAAQRHATHAGVETWPRG
jgi:hypothetical protein